MPPPPPPQKNLLSPLPACTPNKNIHLHINVEGPAPAATQETKLPLLSRPRADSEMKPTCADQNQLVHRVLHVLLLDRHTETGGQVWRPEDRCEDRSGFLPLHRAEPHLRDDFLSEWFHIRQQVSGRGSAPPDRLVSSVTSARSNPGTELTDDTESSARAQTHQEKNYEAQFKEDKKQVLHQNTFTDSRVILLKLDK